MTAARECAPGAVATGRGAGGATGEADPSIVPDAEVQRTHDKDVATLRAELAMAGHTLHQAADGTLIVGRWGLTREFRTVEALRAWAATVTGVRP